MPVFMIAMANIRKKKGVAVSMGVLILLSVAIFNVGLTLLAGINHFYDMENDRLGGAHYMVRFTGNEYREEYLDFFLQDPRVETAETDEFVMMDMASFPEGGVISANFLNMDRSRKIGGYFVAEQTEVPEDEAVYIPVFMKDMGYGLGDELILNYNKKDYHFRIAGFTQSTWLHSSVSSLVNFYMPEKAYEKLYEQQGGGYMLLVRVKDQADLKGLIADFKKNTDVNIEAISMDAKAMEITIDDMRNGTTMVVTIISVVLFVFSFLMVIVAVIVMKFRISNHIDSQMRSIGALGAVGYTGRQIRWSVVLEFIIIGMIGTVLGIALSYGIIAALGGLITSSVGVTWRSGGHIGFDILSAAFIMAVVVLVAWRSAAAAARILPVEALRGGIKSHSFKKEHFPLERTRGSLSMALGLKSMAFNRKMYFMVGIIFAGIAFASAFSIITWWNMGINDDLVLKMTGYEISDIMVYKAPHEDYEELTEKIGAMEGVRKVSLYEMESLSVEGELLSCYVSDDFGKLEMVEVYEGNFPEYDNEIVVTGLLARSWGKKIGDTITVSSNGASAEYVICGLTQTMNNFGRICFMHETGLLRVEPYYEKNSIQVYLEPGLDIDTFIGAMEQSFRVLSPSVSPGNTGADMNSNTDNSTDSGTNAGTNAGTDSGASMDTGTKKQEALAAAKRKAEEKLAALISMYGVDSAQYALMVDGEVVLSGDTNDYEIDRIENNRRLFVSNVDSIADSTRMMAALIITGTVLLVVLVLYMVIKSMLTRRRGEFGIYKALGYTDRQLMEQIAISFLPASVGGTLAGSLAACLSVNRMASLLFEQLGISEMNFVVEPWLILLMAFALVVFAFAVSMVLAGKIRGITVYGLLTEE